MPLASFKLAGFIFQLATIIFLDIADIIQLLAIDSSCSCYLALTNYAMKKILMSDMVTLLEELPLSISLNHFLKS